MAIQLDAEQIVIMKEITSKKSYRAVAEIIGKSLGWVQIQLDRIEAGNYIVKTDRETYPWDLTNKGKELLKRNGIR